MGYSAADESFTHQLPRPFDEVHHPDNTWSDRCYFFAASPDGTLLLASGYGNNPNTKTGLGYVKVTLADGRHYDLMAGRPVSGGDRTDVGAGPMRWTCVEPLKKWKLEVEPNNSGIAWELYYEPSAPMWELLPLKVHGISLFTQMGLADLGVAERPSITRYQDAPRATRRHRGPRWPASC